MIIQTLSPVSFILQALQLYTDYTSTCIEYCINSFHFRAILSDSAVVQGKAVSHNDFGFDPAYITYAAGKNANINEKPKFRCYSIISLMQQVISLMQYFFANYFIITHTLAFNKGPCDLTSSIFETTKSL